MGSAENLAAHERWSDDNDRHDLSHYREYIHDDIEIFHLDGATIVGLEAVTKNMADSIAAMPNRRVVVDDRFATDDRVVCRWRVTGTAGDRGPDGDASIVEVAGISVWEFQDGKARRGWVCSNAAFLMQRGVADAYTIAVDAYAAQDSAGPGG